MSITQEHHLGFSPVSAQVDQHTARIHEPGHEKQPHTLMEAAVHQAIETMHDDLLCAGGIGGIAADTFYSKFHFTREFTRMAGTTPRRFLAALRINKAKELLTTTPFPVAQVGTMVGYSAVGTFSSRFSKLVGISPREWRATGGRVPTTPPYPGEGTSVVHGSVTIADGLTPTTHLYIGLYPDAVPQGTPIACTILDQPGSFTLRGIPQGTWSLIAQASLADTPVRLRARATVTAWFAPEHTIQLPSQLTLTRPTLLDPPAVFEGSQMWEHPTATPRQTGRRPAA